MKLLTSAARAASLQQFGNKPITILKIDWPSGTQYYADSDYTFGANSCAGKIVSLSESASLAKALNTGELSTISVVLDDNDLSIKSKVNTDLIEGTYCTVLFHFDGLASGNAITLLRGRIQGDISWDQGTRQLGFTIDANTLADKEVGFSCTRTTLSTMATDAENKAWPLCFGTVLKVKALNLYKPLKSKTNNLMLPGSTSVLIEDGASWPQGVNTDIDFHDQGYNWSIRCTGQFAGNLFTFSAKNISKYTNLTCIARPVADIDVNRSTVFWLADGSRNLVDTYVYMTIGAVKYVNHVMGQEGNKYFCSKEWRADNTDTNILLDASHTILDVRGVPPASWGAIYKTQYKTAGPFGTFNWYTSSTKDDTTWYVNPGSDVIEIVNSPYTYIANLVASTSILSVYAYRTYAGEKTLQPVPSSYYTKNLSNTVAGKTCTTITFQYPLSNRRFEKWEDDIYVSLVSTIGSNTVDQIEHILVNYSSVTTDVVSFASVKTQITNYPSNFALTSTGSVMGVIEDICYQARLGILISSNIAYLDYLSAVPVVDYSVDESQIKLKSLTLGFTKTEDLVTKYTANWHPDGITDRELVYKNNQNVLGVKSEEREFYIYNIESLVLLSARYWGWRLSNSWRTAEFSVYLPALGLEVFDTIGHSIDALSANGIIGQVTGTSQDTDVQVIKISTTLASISGVSSSGQPTQSNSFYTGDPAYPIGGEPMPATPGSGLVEVDYVVKTDATNINPERVEKKYTISIEFDNDTWQRSVNETVTLTLIDEEANWVGQTVTASLVVASDDPLDAITPTTVTMTGGQFVGTLSIAGGSGIDNAVIRAGVVGNNGVSFTEGISRGFKIQDEGQIDWTAQPYSAVRGKPFTVSLTGGAISAVYNVTVVEQDVPENLKNAAGNVTTITTDASGNYTATDWYFDGGTYVIDDKTIVLERAGNYFPSEKIILIQDTASPGIVYKLTTGGWTLGQVLMNDGAGGWILGAAATAEGKSLGVIARVDGATSYLVVRGLCCLTTVSDHLTYNLGAGVLTSADGFFVLRSYQAQLCWVGGAGTVNKLDDIGDVNATGAADGDILVYDTSITKWVTSVISDPDSIITFDHATAGQAKFSLATNGVVFAKMQQVGARSVLVNNTGTFGNIIALMATADDQVLTRQSGALVWAAVATASLTNNSVTYAKIQQVAATSVLGNGTGALANVAAITASADGQILRRSGGAVAFAAMVAGDLPTSGVTANTYGDGNWTWPIITVDNKGRITSASTASGGVATNSGTGAGSSGLSLSGSTITILSGNPIYNANRINGYAVNATPSNDRQWLKYDTGTSSWKDYFWPSVGGAAQIGFFLAYDNTASGYIDVDAGAAYSVTGNPTSARAVPISLPAEAGEVLCRKVAGDMEFAPTMELGTTASGGGTLTVFFAAGKSIKIDSTGQLVITFGNSNTVTIKESDIVGSSKAIKLREIDECDTAGNAKKRLYLCSAQY